MAIAFVNNVGKAANNTAGQTTVAVTPLQNCGAGNLLALVATAGSNNTVTGVTDTKGNTWTVDKVQGSSGGPASLCTTLQDVGALTTGDTITVTLSGSSANKAVCVREFSGIASGTRLDQTAGADGTTAQALSSGASPATTQASELVLGAVTWAGAATNTFTKGAAFVDAYESDEASGAFVGCALEYQIVSSTGAQTADGSLASAPTSSHIIVATYFAASSAPTVAADPTAKPLILRGGLPTIPGSMAILQSQLPAGPAATLLQVPPATATANAPTPTIDARVLADPAAATANAPTPTIDVRLSPAPAAATVTTPTPQVGTSQEPYERPLALLGGLVTIPGTMVILQEQAPGDYPAVSNQQVLVPAATATVNAPTPAIDARVPPTPAAATASGPTPAIDARVSPTPAAATANAPAPTIALKVAPAAAAATANAPTPAIDASVSPSPAAAVASAPAPGVSVPVIPLDQHPLLGLGVGPLRIPGSMVFLHDQQQADPAALGSGSTLINVPPATAVVSTKNLAWFKGVIDTQTPSGTGGPSQLTVSANIPAGDTVIVVAEWSTVARTLTGVTDTQGNTYTIDAQATGTNTVVATCSTRVTNPLSPGDIITITMGGPTTAGRVHTALWYGGLLVSYIDAGGFGSATDILSGPGTVNGAGSTSTAVEVALAMFGLDFNASAASVAAPYQQRVNTTSGGTVRTLVVADAIQQVTGTQTYTASWTGTLTGSAFLLATYKAASGVGGLVVPGVTIAPVPRTTTVTAPSPQVFWPNNNLILVPAATALVRQTTVQVNNVGVAAGLNEIVRPTQYHQAPLKTYSHGVAVVAGQFTFSSSYQTGGDGFTLPPAFQAAHVVSFHPRGGYVFEFTGTTVKAYLGGTEVAFGTPLNGLGPIPYIAYVTMGQ